jgi:hypothetical protein
MKGHSGVETGGVAADRGVAADKSTARDLGAYICFEDEAGQGLRPPKGRTWAPRGARPVVSVRGAGGGRVSIAGVVCYRPGDRPRLFYQLLVCRRRKGEPRSFAWQDYRDLIVATHQQLGAPVIWCWDNLNIHLAPQLAEFATENKAWLQIYRLPAYAPVWVPRTVSHGLTWPHTAGPGAVSSTFGCADTSRSGTVGTRDPTLRLPGSAAHARLDGPSRAVRAGQRRRDSGPATPGRRSPAPRQDTQTLLGRPGDPIRACPAHP